MTLATNAIGTSAVGVSGNSATQANFVASLSASSTITATLTTAINLAASVAATALVTAILTSSSAQLNTNLASSSSVSGALSTTINLQAALTSAASFVASGLSSAAPLQANIISQSSVTGTLTSQQAAPMFTPSSARTIFVEATSPVFTGSKWWNLTDSKKPRGLKDPEATIDITFDWSDWLNDISPAVISDVTFTPTGVNSVNTFFNGTTATVFISGGVLNVAATVACKIITNTTPPRTDERTVYIDIANE